MKQPCNLHYKRRSQQNMRIESYSKLQGFSCASSTFGPLDLPDVFDGLGHESCTNLCVYNSTTIATVPLLLSLTHTYKYITRCDSTDSCTCAVVEKSGPTSTMSCSLFEHCVPIQCAKNSPHSDTFHKAILHGPGWCRIGWRLFCTPVTITSTITIWNWSLFTA